LNKIFGIISLTFLVINATFAQFPTDPTRKGKAFDSLRLVYQHNEIGRVKVKHNLKTAYQKNKDKEILAYLDLMDFTVNMPNSEIVEKFNANIETISKFRKIIRCL
jgi:hypothetical protein